MSICFCTTKLLKIIEITKRIGNFFKSPIQLFSNSAYPELAFIDFTITTWIGDGLYTTFFGRPHSRNRFKRGDIVEVIGRDEVTLALLLENPPSPEWCWHLYQRCLNGDEDGSMPYFHDASDDCCYLIDGPGHEYHSHVSPLLIMKPRFPIPEEIEKEMKGWLKQLDEQKPNEQNA